MVKLGAKLGIAKNGGDDISDNRTFTVGSFFGDLNASFSGDEQTCATGPDFKGDACVILSTAAEPQSATTTFGDLKITCDAEGFQTNPATACTVTPPPGLAAFFSGEGINLDLLFQVLPKLLEDLRAQLDGAARDASIPVVGDTLDAGAKIVDTFNDNVVTPFSTFVTQLKSTADTDTDGVAEPGEVARKLRSFIYDGAGGAVGGFNGLGPAGAGLLLDLNGDGTVTIDDVVVTPQCNGDACADGTGLGELTDMRVTFKLGKTAFAGELPFDIGLEGFPLKLEGNVASAGKWSVLVDFGMSKEDGPYLVASGKPTKSNDSNMAVNRPPDEPANPDPDGDPDTEDGTPDKWFDQQYLQDDGANFPSFVDVGMTLRRLPQTGVTEARCTITKVESNKLWCDDFSTAGVEGVTWHFHDANDPADRRPPTSTRSSRCTRRTRTRRAARPRSASTPASASATAGRLCRRRRRGSGTATVPPGLLHVALSPRRGGLPRRHCPRQGR